MASDVTKADHLDLWLRNTELECSGASLWPLEEVAIGGEVLKITDLLTVLRQASADRAAVAELVEDIEKIKANCFRSDLTDHTALVGIALIAKEALSRHQENSNG